MKAILDSQTYFCSQDRTRTCKNRVGVEPNFPDASEGDQFRHLTITPLVIHILPDLM